MKSWIIILLSTSMAYAEVVQVEGTGSKARWEWSDKVWKFNSHLDEIQFEAKPCNKLLRDTFEEEWREHESKIVYLEKSDFKFNGRGFDISNPAGKFLKNLPVLFYQLDLTQSVACAPKK